jgi:hypothetical protein
VDRGEEGSVSILVKDRKSGVLVDLDGEDCGTPELAQHGQLELEGDEEGGRHVRVTTQRAIDRYYVGGQLEDPKESDRGYWRWLAANRLHSDFYLSGFEAIAQSTLGGVNTRGSGGNGEVWTDTIVAARQRYNGALKVVGAELQSVLVKVVCHDQTVPVIQVGRRKSRGWGLVALRLALDLLIDYYEARGGIARSRQNGYNA